MSIFDIFKTKKKSSQISGFNLFTANLDFSKSNANRLEDSDLAEICIDRIASHISKLKPKHIRNKKRRFS